MKRPMLVLVALVVLAAVWLAAPVSRRGLESHPRPAASWDEALARVAALEAEDGPAIAPECRTILYSHGARTERVVVLLHGLTNCPAQFDSLARTAYARGANVLVPRLPRHGFADHMTTELARVEADSLCAFTDRVLDAAAGLGEHVTVAGLSIGGTMAAWAAQERADVDRAVLIAPLLGVARARGAWTPVVSRLMRALPNVFVWWDDAKKQDLPGPRHVYPRFSTRSIAAATRIGWRVRGESRRRAPACREVVMVTVGGDLAVDNGLNAAVVANWRARGARSIATYEFPAALRLNHDVVDPEQVGGNPAITYPVLARWIGP